MSGKVQASLHDRIMRKVHVNPSTGCWEWTGALTTKGYGHVFVSRGKYGTVHRIVYEMKSGPIPDGLQLDHLCRVRTCCNPGHLEPVTGLENMHRGSAPSVIASLKGQCLRGHSQAEHAYRKRDGRVAYCRACRRDKRARRT